MVILKSGFFSFHTRSADQTVKFIYSRENHLGFFCLKSYLYSFALNCFKLWYTNLFIE